MYRLTIIYTIFFKTINTYRLSAIRGSQYYDPESYSSHKYLFNIFRCNSEQYNYKEYSLPVVDYYETFVKYLENSESLMDMYKFPDKSDRMLALRPEITPQLCKMVSDKWKDYKDKPLRWYTIADCWRYERPCSGRRRNHMQWNLDIIGSDPVNIDIEPLLVLIQTFQSLGLTSDDVKICINSTEFTPKLLDMITNSITKTPLQNFERVLDKYNRTNNDEFYKLLQDIGFKMPQYQKLLEFLNMNDNNKLLNIFHNPNLESTLSILKSLGLNQWINIDLSIVRGNGYYSGVVYEAFDNKVKRRAVAGGGHYQMKNISQKNLNIECSGFGMGDIVILDILADRKLLPNDINKRESINNKIGD